MFFGSKIDFRIIGVISGETDETDELYTAPRPYHALSLRHVGHARFSHGEREWQVTTNDIIFIPKNYDYYIKADIPETMTVVHFDVYNADFGDIEVFNPSDTEVFNVLFRKLAAVRTAKPVGYEYRLDALFSQVLENIAIQSFSSSHDIRSDFLRILDHLHENFTDPALTVDRLAVSMNISGTYLRRLFRNNLGTSPLRYITRLRIDHATSLLASGYYSVEDAAERSGFSDVKYFSTLYKKETGKTPRESKPH